MKPALQIMLQQAMQAFENKNFESATLTLKKVLQIDSKNLPALHIIGLIKVSQSNYREAIDYLSRAAKINPTDATLQYNLAKALSDLGNDIGAIEHHKKTVTMAPNQPGAWLNYGKSLSNLGRHKDALVCYENSLHFKQDYVEAWSNRGNSLYELKRYDEAIAHYDKALALKPDYVEVWLNKGNTLHELKRYDEAIAHYDKTLCLKPDIDFVYGALVHTKMKICDWSELASSLEILLTKVELGERATDPFPLLAINDDAHLHKKTSERYSQSKYSFNSSLGQIIKTLKYAKIRVGYFSADFHNHATGHLIAELFELHDRSRFELVGFSFGPEANDEMRQRLEKSLNQFIEVGSKSDVEIAKLGRDLNIDIAVDLKGFTQGARTGIFAHRVAPIQVNYLGYPGTMGADYIDYIIADKTLIPPQSQQFYSEKVVYLPNSYQVNDRKRLISERQFTRQELGLPEDSFVFCCFNNNYKILPETFAGWMRILKAVDGSVLWLFQDNSWAVENLREQAKKQGIVPNRLVFAERLPLPEHLARHRKADLFLDTFPYNAHTTASDALWAGLPVLTLMGQSFASRVAASLLNAIQLPELVTTNQEQYDELAIKLAMSPQKLTIIKQKLLNNRLTTPLFDTPLFTANLETAYIKMVERYQAGLEPDHLTVC